MALGLLFSGRCGSTPLQGRKGVDTMKLQEALLCVDCESLYSFSSHCPQCGSQVSYPLGRALNRTAGAESFLAEAMAAVPARPRPLVRPLALLQSA
jgi:hypothetical protein